jgi:hypothetical protein
MHVGERTTTASETSLLVWFQKLPSYPFGAAQVEVHPKTASASNFLEPSESESSIHRAGDRH